MTNIMTGTQTVEVKVSTWIKAHITISLLGIGAAIGFIIARLV